MIGAWIVREIKWCINIQLRTSDAFLPLFWSCFWASKEMELDTLLRIVQRHLRESSFFFPLAWHLCTGISWSQKGMCISLYCVAYRSVGGIIPALHWIDTQMEEFKRK